MLNPIFFSFTLTVVVAVFVIAERAVTEGSVSISDSEITLANFGKSLKDYIGLKTIVIIKTKCFSPLLKRFWCLLQKTKQRLYFHLATLVFDRHHAHEGIICL